jgi:FkbM family methyltransferase
MEWFGSTYGGFFVCTDTLATQSPDKSIIVYSAGVGEDISFDLAMMDRYPNADIYAFDPTPKSISWVEAQSIPGRWHFSPIAVGAACGSMQMHLPKNANHVSGSAVNADHLLDDTISVEMKSIGAIMHEFGHAYVDVLKLDIEGSEFEVLESIDFSKDSFGQILVEVHERFFTDGWKRFERCYAYLKKSGYALFAVSANGEELSFINTGAAPL